MIIEIEKVKHVPPLLKMEVLVPSEIPFPAVEC